MADKNKRSSASFVPFKPLDNLFEPTVQEKPAPAENGLTNLSVDDLHSFKDHPFRLYAEDKMAEMVESVQEHGVITPILVRPAKDGDGYLNICAGGQNGAGPYIHRIQVLDNITAHMLRHTYATMLFDADVDVKSAQKFLGHADLEVTLEIYTHLSEYKEEKAIAALNTHLDSLTGYSSTESVAS